jgi:hypothetical protein
MNKEEFIDILDNFVKDNYTVQYGTEDSYIEQDDWRGSFDKAIIELAKKLGIWKIAFEKE